MPSDYTFIAGDNGTHIFTNAITFKTSGNQDVTVTDTSNGALTDTTANITVNAASANALVFSAMPTPVIAGDLLDFTLTAKDEFGNTLTDYVNDVTFSTTDTNATIPGTYSFVPGDNGTHTFNDATILKTVGNHSISAQDTTDPGLAGVSSVITVNAAALSQIEITGISSSVTQGASNSFVLSAYDEFKNLITNYAGNIVFSSSDATATVPADYTFGIADLGNHDFSGLVFNSTGTQTFTANDTVNIINTTVTTKVNSNAPIPPEEPADEEEEDTEVTIPEGPPRFTFITPAGTDENTEETEDENAEENSNDSQDEKTGEDQKNEDKSKFEEIVGNFGNNIVNSAKEIEKVGREFIVNSGNTTAAVVATATATTFAAAPLINIGLEFKNLLPQITNSFFVFMQMLGIRRRRNPWGIVFNLVTGQPVANAIVKITDKEFQKVRETIVTDIDGRFGFLVQPGTYFITVSRNDFEFKGMHESSDFFDNLYDGNEFEVKADQMPVLNIALKPLKTNVSSFNLSAKLIKLNHLIEKLQIPLLIVGIIISLLIIAVLGFQLYYILALFLYVLVIIKITCFKKVKSFGVITGKDGEILQTAIVRAYNKRSKKLIATDVTDSLGRYTFLLGSGLYMISAQKPGYFESVSFVASFSKEKTQIHKDLNLKKAD